MSEEDIDKVVVSEEDVIKFARVFVRFELVS